MLGVRSRQLRVAIGGRDQSLVTRLPRSGGEILAQRLFWATAQIHQERTGLEQELSEPSTASSSKSDERNIFEEVEQAEELERDAEALAKGNSLLQRQRDAMASQPAWTGDERVQDTVLRMLMDKHQPSRVKDGMQSQTVSSTQHPADVKMFSVQKPNRIGSPSALAAAAAATYPTPSPAEIATAAASTLPPPNEDGRRLAKTPDNKPWRAVYVNPMLSTDSDGTPSEPSIYYAKYYGQHMSPGRSRTASAKTASGKDRLKLAGIKMETLPLDDRNKMMAIRKSVQRWDRAGRMRGVKEEAMHYRRLREEEREAGAISSDSDPISSMTEEEVEALLNAEGVLKEGEEIRLSSASDSKPGETQIGMMGGRGFTSIANERIEAALKSAEFRQNSLRGKPLNRDVHASNPYLKGEERIMNRIVQRQGAAPPWVELNVQLESEQSDFRRRLADSWIRRASRIVMATSHLRDGLEPLSGIANEETFDAVEQRASTMSEGQRRLVTLVKTYVDTEWEQRERAYHEASLRDVNNLVRKYNIVAPVTARRGLLVREWELERVRKDERISLLRRLSYDLSPEQRSSSSFSSSTSSTGAPASMFGVRANPDRSAYIQESDNTRALPTSFSGGGSEGDSRSGSKNAQGYGDDVRRQRRTSVSPYGIGFAALMRRTAQRARQFVNW